jgi:hypothetical protein
MGVQRSLAEFRSRERYVSALMEVSRSNDRDRSRRDESQFQEELLELAGEHPRLG